MGRKKIIVDTSAWLAYILKNERAHKAIKEIFSGETEGGTVFFTTNDIVDETVTRLIYDNNFPTAQKFLTLLGKSITERTLTQLWTDEQIQQEAFSLLAQYHDHKLSLTDATTVAIMKRFKLDAVLTLDADFQKIGMSSLPF